LQKDVCHLAKKVFIYLGLFKEIPYNRERVMHKNNLFLYIISLLLTLGLFSACTKFQPAIGYNKGYQPDQPIPFDHSLHAGTNQIKCQYCHNQVERSRHANIPTSSTCMNCHIQIKTDSPWIKQMRDAMEKGESIEWTRVHMLPDHVQFNHSAHVQKGVSCATCHGPVDTMKTVAQFSDLSMGWCINCHRQPENKAPLNCTTCHH
jgi:hypothetical protein